MIIYERSDELLKVLFVVDRLDEGGAGRVISLLANYFVKDNDVMILRLNNNLVSYELNDKIELLFINHFFDFSFNLKIKKIMDVISTKKPDIVVSFLSQINVYSIIACNKIGVKIIVSERNNPRINPKNIIKRIYRNHIYKRADGLVFQTKKAQNYFCRIIRNKSKIILNPISSDIPIRFEFDENKVICVGRLVKQKNYKMTIKSFALFKTQNPNAKLYIYGDGPEREKIKKMILQNNLEKDVFLKGNVSNIYEEMSNSNLFIMTSYYEGLSNALIEAMAIGLPCVVTDESNGGSRELIESGENGYLVRINDFADFAKKMDVAINDNNNYFSSNAKKIRERLGINNIANQWLDYVREILEKY